MLAGSMPPPRRQDDSYIQHAIKLIAASAEENRSFRNEWHESERRRSLREEANHELVRKEMLAIRQALIEVQDRSVRSERDIQGLKEQLAEERRLQSSIVDDLSRFRAEFEDHVAESSNSRIPVSQSVCVLVVDDSEPLRYTIGQLLRSHGMRADLAGSVLDAEDIIGSGIVDVAVIDLHLDGDDGMVLVRWIQAHHPRIGVLILTGRISQDEANEARARGVRVVKKPFSSQGLVTAILEARR